MPPPIAVPLEAPLAAPLDEATAAAELLEDEQMENDQTPVFLPMGPAGQSAGDGYGAPLAAPSQPREPVLQATAFLTEDEPAEPRPEVRLAQAMSAPPEGEAPRPAAPRTASRSQPALAAEELEEDWQPPPPRRKKLIIMVALAAVVGGGAAALVVGLFGKTPVPVQQKPVAKKVTTATSPAGKAAPPASKAAPAAAEKPATAAAPATPVADKSRPASKAAPAATEKAAADNAPRGDKATADKAKPEKPSVAEPASAKPSAPVAASGKLVPATAPPSPKPAAVSTKVASGRWRVPVASHPEGAMVWINGEERGKTPCSVELGPGSARVVLVRAGYLARQSTVEVREGTKVDETLTPVEPPMTGDARFRAECKTEGKLPIVVDGKETGILCPYSKMRVEPGTHTIGLFVPATGKVHNKEIILFAGVRSVVFGD
jgi:hypothetical protein